MRLEFGSDTKWNCLKKFSMRCNRNLARAQFGIVLEFFRLDAIGVWLGNNLKVPQSILDEMQLGFG